MLIHRPHSFVPERLTIDSTFPFLCGLARESVSSDAGSMETDILAQNSLADIILRASDHLDEFVGRLLSGV